MIKKIESNRKVITTVLLCLVMCTGLLLRVFNIGHTLGYDEAWNTVSIDAVASGAPSDIFYDNFFRHPPLYTGIGVSAGMLAGMDRWKVAVFMEIISILCALGLMAVIYLCGREWFSGEAGLFAAFLFAVMPAARFYDSFIKQESLTLLLVLLFLYFFFRKRYLVAGLFIGLSALTKEIFIFPFIALLLFLIVARKWKPLKGFAVSAGIAFLLSFWWYYFFSTSRGEFIDFFLGGSSEAVNWSRPWYFYLQRMPEDLGWVTLATAVGGASFAVFKRNGSRGDGPEDFSPGSMALFVLMWIAVVYLVNSCSFGKPPWTIYAALPAVALMGGYCLSLIPGLFSDRSRAGNTVCALILAAALGFSISTGFYSFIMRADPTYEMAKEHRAVAGYINRSGGTRDRAFFRIGDFSPNLAFYLNIYEPGNIAVLPTLTGKKQEPPDKKYRVLMLVREVSTPEVARWLEKVPSEFLVLRHGRDVEGVGDITWKLEVILPVKKFEHLWVFTTGSFSDREQSGKTGL